MMTNDNFYLKSIISGEMTGTPEIRAYYLGVLFSSVVSTLYHMIPAIPWYGYVMILSVMMSLSYVIYKVITSASGHFTRLVLLLFCLLISYGFFTQHIVKVEFTTITGIVGCTGLFSFYLLDESQKYFRYLISIIPFILFSLWSLGMRDKGFYMLLPFLGMILLGKILTVANSKNFHHALNLLLLLILLVAVITLPRSVSKIIYGSEKWENFRSYTDASEQIYDFYGFPDYDSHIALYEDLGITRSSLEAATTHYNILLDPSIDQDSMEKLAQVAREESRLNSPPFAKKLKDICLEFINRNFLTYSERPLNVLVYLLYAICFVLILAGRDLTALRDYLFLIFARSFVWVYLLWGGRYPFRVTQIIFTADLFLLTGIMIRHRLWALAPKTVKSRRVYPAALCLILLTGAAALRFGVPVARAHIGEVNSWYHFSACYRELEDYLFEHSDNFYYFDMSSLYFTEEALATPRTVTDPTTGKVKVAQKNYLYMGSWMPNSPWYDTVFSQQGITNIGDALISKENVYLIYQPVADEEPVFLKDYYSDHYPHSELRKVGELQTSTGMRYEFWKGYRS